MRYLIIHTASLYYWFDDYEASLDERIHAALDAGLDGVEISNGPSILNWQPDKETIKRLQDKVVTIHAELGGDFGYGFDEWAKAVKRLPLKIAWAVFHPDELKPGEFSKLLKLPFPATIENMDAGCLKDITIQQLRRTIPRGVGFTFDTAHAEENGLDWQHFNSLTPLETHLSIPNDNYYTDWGYNTRHALTQMRPDDFPAVPSSCPVVTLEGLVPPDMDMLKDEVKFVRGRLL